MATILLVEDDEMIQDLVVLHLAGAGHEVVTADNGKIGVEKALAVQPDMILMDMHMPFMNGQEATEILRGGGYEGLIVALTASTVGADSDQAENAGCNSIILKPITAEFGNKWPHNLLNSRLRRTGSRRQIGHQALVGQQ